jgi:hypothetical protein
MNDFIQIFLSSTEKQWENMYENHIHKLNIIHETNIIESKIKNYKFTNIVKPEWYIITHNNLYPQYENENDDIFLEILRNILGEKKTLFMIHITESKIFNNISVSNEITFFINNLTKNLSGIDIIKKISLTPIKNMFMKNTNEFYYETLKIGLLNKNLKKLFLINPKQLVYIVDFIFDNKDILIEDISIIDNIRSVELKNIIINKKNILVKIWKNLDTCIFYQNNENIIANYVKIFISKQVKIYTPVYANNLCIIGYDIFNDGSYIMDTRKAYFEFKDIINNKIYGMRNIKKNNLYNIIISSTQSNVIRCISNNIVKVIDFYNNVPKIIHICSSNNYQEILEIESLIIKYSPLDYCYRKQDKQIIIYIEVFDSNNIDIKNIEKPYIIKIVRSGTFKKLYNFDKLLVCEKDMEIMRNGVIYVSS